MITKETRTFAPCPVGDGYGITLREYFAGLAMQGLYAGDGRSGYKFASFVNAAKASVEAADALLAELAKPVTHRSEP